mgnify:FL=1
MYIDMNISKCRKCGGIINTDTDKELCGYGKCMSCCRGECGHSVHLNTDYKPA